VDFDKALRDIRANYSDTTNQMLQVLIDSHDTDRLASMLRNPGRNYDRQAGPRDDRSYDPRRPHWGHRRVQRLMAAFQMTYVGAPMIYYGTEAGMWGADDPDDRKPMVWPDLTYEPETYSSVSNFSDSDTVTFDHELFDYYRKLIELRKRHPALRVGDFVTLLTSGEVYAYHRTAMDDTVVIIFNNDEHERHLDLPVPWIMATDELNGGRYAATGGKISLMLPAKGAMILVDGEAR
jgi:glycosidase